jgi:ribosomal protein L29
MATPKKSAVAKPINRKKTDYSKMSTTDLLISVNELREEAITLKRNSLIGDVQNVRAPRYKRKELAQVLTILNNQKVDKEN